MIDIHSHILPGVDDGSGCIEDSLAMADIAVKSGVKIMVATPHSNQRRIFENYASPELEENFFMLRSAIKEAGIPLLLILGMEIFGTEDILEKIYSGKVIPLGKSDYYLVEFAFNESPGVIDEILRGMLNEGFIPIIAHPERYYCVQDEPELLYEWRKLGVIVQMNKGSIFGSFGETACRTAKIILSHNMVNIIAGDAHSPYVRTPDMTEIEEYLLTRYSPEYKDLLLIKNPAAVLKNLKIKNPAPIEL